MAGSGIVAGTDIDIAYEMSGDPAGRPLLLVAGGGHSLISWRPRLCALLAAHGFSVIRFDDRDVGGSTHPHDAGVPDPMAAVAGDASSSAYPLDDMADRATARRRCGIRVPTLVVHGDSDPLISVDAGRATAALIPDAELLVVPGMGHDLPPAVRPQLVDAVYRHARRADPDPVPA